MRTKLAPYCLVAVLAILYSGLFTYIAFLRHDSFTTWAFDLGNMDQAVWNTLQGRPLAFTNMEGVTTRFAIHCEPTLILISPIYLLWSNPKVLLLFQSVALATGAFPVFWIARSELKSSSAGVIASACYLLFPSLEAVNMAEFHTVSLAAPLLLWAYFLASTGHWTWYTILSLLAMGTKEEVGLVVAFLGIYLSITRRSVLPALIAAVGIIWSLISILVVIPAFNPKNSSPYAGYYSYLGSNLVEIAINILTHPWIPVQRILSEPEYLKSLLMPNGYLALLSPERLVLGLPTLLINLMSSNGEMGRANLYHYTAPLIPAIMLATIAGARRATNLINRFGVTYGQATALVMFILLFSTASYHRQEGLTPLSVKFSMPSITQHDMIGHQMVRLVPDGVSLSVHPDLNPHLSQRQKLYVFPRVEDAEYVLMDRLRDVSSRDPIKDPTRGHRDRLNTLNELLNSGEWEVIVDHDGYILLKRKG